MTQYQGDGVRSATDSHVSLALTKAGSWQAIEYATDAVELPPFASLPWMPIASVHGEAAVALVLLLVVVRLCQR